MKTLFGIAMAAASLLGAGASFAQSANMMNGGTWWHGWT